MAHSISEGLPVDAVGDMKCTLIGQGGPESGILPKHLHYSKDGVLYSGDGIKQIIRHNVTKHIL